MSSIQLAMAALLDLSQSDGFRVAFLAATLFVLYILGRVIYNIYFHPLSHFPGPRLWGATCIPYAISIRKGDLIYRTEEIHRKYGDVVRLCPNELSFIDEHAPVDIYGHKSAGRASFQKDPFRYRPAPNGVHSILSANDADHSRIRRLLAHAFSDKALHEQQLMLQEYVDLLMQSLRTQAQAKNTINIPDWFNYVTFDIIGELCFGESFDCLRSAAYHPWISILFHYFKSSALVTSTLMLPGMSTIVPWAMPKKAIQRRIDHFNTTKAKVHQRLEGGQNKPDFMTYVLRHNDEKGMTIAEIEATFTILATAGAETTATALTGMINHLAKDHTTLAKLTTEIRTTYSSEDQMTMESLAKLPYLNAVIDEGLRMCPPVPTGSPRIVPAGGETVCGYWIPTGTVISYAPWSAYRSPANFHLPESFDPDRWLPCGPSSPYADDARACMQPFAVGPRNCIGRNLAYLEMRLILARLLWNFDVEASDGKGGPEWRGQKVFILWEKTSLEVNLTTVRDY